MEEASRFGSYALGKAEKPTYKVGDRVLVTIFYDNRTGVPDVREMTVLDVSANGNAAKVGRGDDESRAFWVEIGRIVDSVAT